VFVLEADEEEAAAKAKRKQEKAARKAAEAAAAAQVVRYLSIYACICLLLKFISIDGMFFIRYHPNLKE
jgi:hypothetical protein